MKRFYFLSVVLLLTTILTNAQTPRQDDSTKYIWYQNQYGMRQPRIASDSFNLIPYGDTSGRRPYRNGAIMMYSGDGKIYKWNNGTGWNLSSGSPFAISNVGTGVRLVKTPSGQVKTIVFGYGTTGDSTTNTDAITVKVDTVSSNKIITQSKLNDTAAAIRVSAARIDTVNLQGVLTKGNTTNIPIISSANIHGDTSRFSNSYTRGRLQVGDTILVNKWIMTVGGSSISAGFAANFSYSMRIGQFYQTTLNDISVSGSSISTGANSLWSKISTFPNYTNKTLLFVFDAGINDFISQPDTNVYKARLGEVIDSLKAIRLFPDSTILILSPPYSPFRLGDSIYVGINQRVIAAHGGYAMDIFHPMQFAYTHGRTGLIHSDSLHMTDSGQIFIYDMVERFIHNKGYYNAQLNVYGDANFRKDINVDSNATFKSNVYIKDAIQQSAPNGSVNIRSADITTLGQYSELSFVPNPVDTFFAKDSVSLRLTSQSGGASTFGIYKRKVGSIFPILSCGYQTGTGECVMLRTDVPQAGYDIVLGSHTYVKGKLYVEGPYKFLSDNSTDPQRITLWSFSTGYRAAIGFETTYGLQIGCGYTGVTLGTISTSDGSTFTPSLHLPTGTTHSLFNTMTDNGIGTIQANGKVTIAVVDSISNLPNVLCITPGTGELKKAAFPGPTIYRGALSSFSWGSLSANSAATTTVTITGASVGDIVNIAPSDGSANAAGEFFDAIVSGSNTVTIRRSNTTDGGMSSGTRSFNIIVIKY